MADTPNWYGQGLIGFIKGDFKWLTSGGSTFKVALLLNTYTFNKDTHDFWDDVSSYEISESGTYAAGGATLTTYDPTYDSASDQVRIDAADVQWTGVTATAGFFVIYQSTGTAGTSRLLMCQELDPDKVASAGAIDLAFDAAGVAYIDLT